jgi:hypothetical protein
VLAWFVGRKIRTFPALTGDSSYLRLAHDASLVALGREIARRPWPRGIFKMDFKRRPTGAIACWRSIPASTSGITSAP